MEVIRITEDCSQISLSPKSDKQSDVEQGCGLTEQQLEQPWQPQRQEPAHPWSPLSSVLRLLDNY
jgi:hypothetical protein